jgi:ribonuclease HI
MARKTTASSKSRTQTSLTITPPPSRSPPLHQPSTPSIFRRRTSPNLNIPTPKTGSNLRPSALSSFQNFSDESDISDAEVDYHEIRHQKSAFRNQAHASSPENGDRSPFSSPNTQQPNSQSQGCFPFVSSPRHAPTNAADILDIIMKYALQGSFWIDGGCKRKTGSFAFVGFTLSKCSLRAVKSDGPATNNQMEFQALLSALHSAREQKLKRFLVVADSALVSNFLRGTNSILHQGLTHIIGQIKALLPSFEAVYVAKVPSHQDAAIENDVADLLCSWAIETGHSVEHEGTLALPRERRQPQTIAQQVEQLREINAQHVSAILDKLAALPHAQTTTPSCKHCTLEHGNDACVLKRFTDSDFTKPRCLACCSPLHTFQDCPLLTHVSRRPCLSSFTPLPLVPPDEHDILRANSLYTADFDTLRFPNQCSRRQFLEYFHVVFTALSTATTQAHVDAVVRAVKVWNDNFYFQSLFIRRRKSIRPVDARNRGDNRNPKPTDPELTRARAALRAAFLLPKARISDVSKALRTGTRLPLTDDIIAQLHLCYPVAAEDERIDFEPTPLPNFAVDRNALARAVMSRSTSSHPGATGFSFSILQCYCKWTYGAEADSDSPDPRWDTLCSLISKIMSGNATDLSDHLLDVVLAFFDKNAEKPGAPFSLRNIGIEESLLRISATLVFQNILPTAITKGFITSFDLGAGKKAGAEIFGRLAAFFAQAGAPVAVFDIIKAFNNLRRKDIKDAVAAVNDPLLTAFVHFLFSKNSKVSFTCPLNGRSFTAWLTQGIHQGNPLSVFLFVLTIAFILKPFRAKFPDALIPAFVDDIIFSMAPSRCQPFPAAMQEFVQLFANHGLRFDLSDSAKSSVFSVDPLPADMQNQLCAIGMRCQTNGIAPCKIPFGSADFYSAFSLKALSKLRIRFEAFRDLLPALCKLDHSRRTPTHRNYEHFLNLVRLSFLSMSTYTLRTLKPSYCATYSAAASDMALTLIRLVLPPLVELPPSPKSNNLLYPDLVEVSKTIIQLPLTLGGLSLRLPDSIADLAYAASAADCLPMLYRAASHLSIPFDYRLIPELRETRARIAFALPSINPAFWRKIEDPDDDEFSDVSLQHHLTERLNAVSIASLSTLLKPWPAFFHAFSSRTAKEQDHVSWTFNPKARSFYGIGMLSDAEFSRSIALAVLHPVLRPRYCSCGQPIDPAGLHLLHCHFNHYGELHDCVKMALHNRLRSFMTSDAASFSVATEQPMSFYFGRRNPTARHQPEGFADLVVSMHSSLQQIPVAVDIVSCLPIRNSSYQVVLQSCARSKRRKYSGFLFPPNSFYPLPFGRLNTFSEEIFSFCSFIGNFLPKHMRAEPKLRATISRAVYAGSSRLYNLAFRRLQLSASQGLPVSTFRFSSLLEPYARELFDRSARRDPHWTSLPEASLPVRLAAALNSPNPADVQVGVDRHRWRSGRSGANE